MGRYLFLSLVMLFFSKCSFSQKLPTFSSKSKIEKSLIKQKGNQEKQNTPVKNNNSKQKESENFSNRSVVQNKKFLLKINCNTDANLFIDGEKIATVKNGELYKLFLDRGVYDLRMNSLNTPSFEKMESYKVLNNEDQDIWHVYLREKEDKYFLNQKKLKELSEDLDDIIHYNFMPAYNDRTDGNFFSYYYPSYSIDNNLNLKIVIQSQQKWPDGRESDKHGFITAIMNLKDLNKISVKRYKFDNPDLNNELYVIEFGGICFKYFGSNTTDKISATSMFIPITTALRTDCQDEINELLKTFSLPLNFN